MHWLLKTKVQKKTKIKRKANLTFNIGYVDMPVFRYTGFFLFWFLFCLFLFLCDRISLCSPGLETYTRLRLAVSPWQFSCLSLLSAGVTSVIDIRDLAGFVLSIILNF